jgi:hypothetical protein
LSSPSLELRVGANPVENQVPGLDFEFLAKPPTGAAASRQCAAVSRARASSAADRETDGLDRVTLRLCVTGAP